MEIKTCKRCGSIFQYVMGKTVCPRCRKKEEELFQMVKDYLRANPGASMTQVSEETGASVAMIEAFLREGRIEVTADSPLGIHCERCGTKIRTGKLCDKCRTEVSNDLHGIAKSIKADNAIKPKQNETERMRFLQSDKIR